VASGKESHDSLLCELVTPFSQGRRFAALGEQWDDVPRRSLEAIAVEGYRSGALTESQVRRLLELDTRFQVHALLKEHHVPLQYTAADREDDLRAQRELGILPNR